MSRFKDLPIPLQMAVDLELDGAERVAWVERPERRFFTRGSVGRFLFAVPWTIFTLAGVWGSVVANPGLQARIFFVLVGAIFASVGFTLLLSPLQTYWILASTAYAITDKRALIVRGRIWRTVHSFYPTQLVRIVRRDYPDGLGDILFAEPRAEEEPMGAAQGDTGFFRIQGPADAEKLLVDLADR
jgi:hypothetical protein